MKILEVKNLKTYFYTSHGVVKAVDGVNFNIEKGSVFGIVGESGSGKTLTALSVLKLIGWPARIESGEVIFNGRNLLSLGEKELNKIRGAKISMVFQEPSSSFNPVFTIGEQIVEAILAHQDIGTSTSLGTDPERSRRVGKVKAGEAAFEYLERCRIDDVKRVFHDYPHQLSGGTKQRAMIAMALVNSPELVILDEPTTALDVTIQARILDLLNEIIHKEKLSILFISHDFGVIARMCDNVAVMHEGRIVETGDTQQVLSNPKERYTASLLESVKALAC